MAEGYRTAILFRFTPTAGTVETVDCRAAFRDLTGHAEAVVEYNEELTRRLDVNRARRVVVHGYRPRVRVLFTIITTEDQAAFANITARLGAANYTSEISCDGGVVFRQCVLDRVEGPVPLSGKPYAGATWGVTVDCVQLLTQVPVQTTGDPITSLNKLQNPDFTTWTVDANAPDGWGMNEAAGNTIDKVTVATQTPPNALRISRAEGATFSGFNQAHGTMVPGATYRVGFWHKPFASGIGNTLQCTYKNTTRNMVVGNDGVTWAATGALWNEAPAGAYLNTWTYREKLVRIDPTFQLSDAYLIQCAPYFNGGNTVNWDTFQVFGPIYPTGVVGW